MNYANVNPNYVWSIDIETAANHDAEKFHIKFDDESIKAPSNWKDQEKIDAYVKEKKLEIGRKDALSWLTGKIVSIAAVNVGDVGSGKKDFRKIVFGGADEKTILTKFQEEINKSSNDVFQLVGKNSSSFDYPFIKGRLMANNIPSLEVMKNTNNLFDIDKMICMHSGNNQNGKLDHYAFALGLEQKSMHGSMVPKLYEDALIARANKNNEEYARIMTSIMEYNVQDTIIVAHIAYRLLGGGL